MESHTVIESFTHLDDAVYFFESALRDYATEDYEVQQGSGIQFINSQWRVGLNVERTLRKVVTDEQIIQEDLPFFDENQDFIDGN